MSELSAYTYECNEDQKPTETINNIVFSFKKLVNLELNLLKTIFNIWV